jgi:hypothetical protein
MNRHPIALFCELADRSPAERDAYYARHRVPAALRVEGESLLSFDDESSDPLHGFVASAVERFVLLCDGAAGAHPNIARLLDAGHLEHGQPFLVMVTTRDATRPSKWRPS